MNIEGLKIKYCGKVLEALLIDKLPSKYGIEKPDLPIWSTEKKVFSRNSGFCEIIKHMLIASNGMIKIHKLNFLI
tara:strand:- start:104 stop:328 length:225 start_codon:yes stop_codon:yes gene_type:complete